MSTKYAAGSVEAWSYSIGPVAAICAAFVVLRPTLAIWRRDAASRCRVDELCRSCGYDLRATPGRCPECGTIPIPIGPG